MHIKYLAVDADPSSIGDNGNVDTLDVNTEFFDISCPDISGLLGKAFLLAQDPSLQWLKAEGTQGEGHSISILSAEAGAGGVRQIGRLLLMQNCKQFVEKLRKIITDALRDLKKPSINIHIFTGLGGGTGAGTFLDVCYILQHVLEDIGIRDSAHVCGYFFLPDVNMSEKPNIDYVPINGFAAMKELDYAMNYHNNGSEWRQQYDGFEVKTKRPPVKLAHLVSATDAQGHIRTNGYNYAMRVVVDYVLEYIIKPYIPPMTDDAEVEKPVTIKSHISNVELHIQTVDQRHGACYHYCVLGAANAYLPYKDITTYLTSKIFESFQGLRKQTPTDADVEAFVMDNRLDYNDIFRDLLDGVPGIPFYAVDTQTLFEQAERLSSDQIPRVLGQMRAGLSPINGRLAQNKKVLTDPTAPHDAQTTTQILALKLRVQEALAQIAVRPEKGPYYACRLLYSTEARDIRSWIVNHRGTNENHLRHARADFELREQEMEDALRLFQNSGKLKRKKLGQRYVESVHAYFMQQARIDQLTTLADLLEDLETQLNQLHEGFFGIFEDMMRELQATFDSNLSTLAEPVLDDNGYAMKLMTVQELKPSLDKAVADMQKETQIHDFVSMMLGNPDIWIGQDENKICKAVTDYFLRQLSTYTQRTMVDYLKIKFKTTSMNALQSEIYKNIIQPLAQRAWPLFWTNTGYHLTDAKSMGYLSIPNISTAITAAAQDYKNNTPNGDISIRTAWGSDRITLYGFYCGVPMFGYKGVSNYLPDYKRRTIVGSHIYEGAVNDPRDSRKLVDIAPVSYVQPEAYSEGVKADLALYDLARTKEIISVADLGNLKEYRINRLDKAWIETWTEAADRLLALGDITKAQEHLGTLKEKGLPIEGHRVIENTGSAVNAETVVQDHIVDSEMHMKLVRKQMALLEGLEEKRDTLQAGVQKWSSFISDMHNFAFALSSGVIQKENDYTYRYAADFFGMETYNELTNIDAEPYGMALPLYSAYRGYVALEEEEKSGIEKTVKNYLVNKKETVDAAVAQLRGELSGEKINARLSTAKVTFPEQAEEIGNFFKRLLAEFNNFAAMR